MHPRSPYSSSVSFALLAERFPELKQYLIHEAKTIDFQNPDAVRCLSAALLKTDWNLDVDFGGKIVPGVPSRLNYVLFIQDFLDSTFPRGSTKGSDDSVGLDIGTGASAIYPLLAVRSRPSWKMLATELDPTSLKTAVENVARNGLSDQITVIEAECTSDETEPSVLPLNFLRRLASEPNKWVGPAKTLDFTMCNPPFFDSTREQKDHKALPPRAVCEATPSELMTNGGELQFVKRMIWESKNIWEDQGQDGLRIRWFTTLLGHKGSVEPLVKELRENGIRNYAISRLTTGQNWKGTVRWVLAWSFEDIRPPLEIARGGGITMKPFWPEVGELSIPNVTMERILQTIASLNSRYIEVVHGKRETLGWCDRDVWSRKARRAMQRGEEVRHGQDGGVGWRLVKDEDIKGVCIVWREGKDRVLFESWSGWLKREATKVERPEDSAPLDSAPMEL